MVVLIALRFGAKIWRTHVRELSENLKMPLKEDGQNCVVYY